MLPLIPIFIGAGGIAALVALLSSDSKKALHPEIKGMLAAAERTGDEQLIVEAALFADREKMPAVAQAIRKRLIGLNVENPNYVHTSPFPSIANDVQWTKFVNCSKAATPHAVTAAFHFGYFLFGVRRLVDLQIMRNPKQITFQGKRVWSGEWIPPWTLKRFLADTAEQYRVLTASVMDYAKRIGVNPILRASLGKIIDGRTVTLSGLLSVCHRAGFAGAQSWVRNAKDRAKFTATSEGFAKCNGIF